MTYKIWNKVDDINGVNANVILKRHNIKKEDEIFLVLDGNRVIEMQFKNVIKNTYNISSNDIEQVAQEYLRIKEEEKLQAEKEQINLEEQRNKISILEAENEKLKVEQEQQNEEILVNMLANTEMFEMILGMMPMTLNV